MDYATLTADQCAGLSADQWAALPLDPPMPTLTLALPGNATSANVNTPVTATLTLTGGATATGAPTVDAGSVLAYSLPSGATSGTVTIQPPVAAGTVNVSVPTNAGNLAAALTVSAGTLAIVPSTIPAGSPQLVSLIGSGLSGSPAFSGPAMIGLGLVSADHRSQPMTVTGTASGTLSITDAGGVTATAVITPAQPAAPRVTPASGSVMVQWSAAAGATTYNLYRTPTGGAAVQVYSGPALAYADAGLTNGTTYSYALMALDGSGNAGPSSAAATATPSVPTVAPGRAIDVTPSDNADLPFVARRIRSSVTGSVQVMPLVGGGPVVIPVAAGEELDLPVTRVYATNTSSGTIAAIS